jgi:hypothetical protein
MSGRCTFEVGSGQRRLLCDCPNRVFGTSLDTNTIEPKCKECAQDVNIASAQPQSQGMSPFISIISSIVADGPVIGVGPSHTIKYQKNPNDSPRRGTVAALWDQIQQVGVVHVRGTPASGKSTLAFLLDEYVRETSDINTYIFSWPLGFEKAGLSKTSPYLNKITNDRRDNWFGRKELLIIDEAQGSYGYTSLWNDFIKGSGPGLYPLIVLFSSYGSPSDRPLGTQALVSFQPSQRVSIRCTPQNPNLGLFFNRAEFDDVVQRVCKSYGQHGQAFHPSPELVDYVWEITNGHPAGVHAVLDYLAEVSIDYHFHLYF